MKGVREDREKIQRPTRLAIAAVVALAAITGIIVPLGAIGVLSSIQKRPSTAPLIDNAVVKDIGAKEDEKLAKERLAEEWLAKRKSFFEELRSQIPSNVQIILDCNGTTKYKNEEGNDYNRRTPVRDLKIVVDLRTNSILRFDAVFGIVANIYKVDHATIFFEGRDDSNRITARTTRGTIDGTTGKVYVTSRFILHTDIPSSSSQSELICAPA